MKKDKNTINIKKQDERNLYNLIDIIKKKYCTINYNNCVHCAFNYYGTCLASEFMDSLDFIIEEDF